MVFLILLLSFLMTFCVDKSRLDLNVDNQKKNQVELRKVKIYDNESLKDTLINVRPIVSSDSLRYISIYSDTSVNQLQKEVFKLRKVSKWSGHKIRIVKFWFTGIVNQTDTTTDVGLFILTHKDEVWERARFRFNDSNNISMVSNSPSSPDTFIPLDNWKADSVALPD